jgi:hypothetical protein
MNFTLSRLVQGILGAIVGAGMYLSFYDFDNHNLKFITLTIIAAVFFFISFLWWEQIINILTKVSPQKKDKDHERDE